MKKVIVLCIVSFVFASCSKKETKPAENEYTKVLVRTFREKLLAGIVKDTIRINALIFVWNASNRNFEINSSLTAVAGVAHDNTSNEDLKSDYKGNGSSYEITLKKGKYFVCVVVSDDDGLGSYSYRTFDVNGEVGIVIDKVFPVDIPFSQKIDW